MTKDSYEKLFQFRGNQIHKDIVRKYQEKYPEYSKEADVLRHAVVLLDKEMRKKNGQDEMFVVIKKLGDLERSNNALRVQMDVLIKLNMELISRSGSGLKWEDVEQEVKNKIGSSVTKKSEDQLPRSANRMQANLKLEENAVNLGVQEIKPTLGGNVVTSGIQKMQQPLMSPKRLPTISDEEQLVMKYGKPHKSIIIAGRTYYEEVEWEQIPEHRRYELRQS